MLSKLDKREKIVLLGGGVLAALMLIYFLPVTWALDYETDLKQQIRSRKQSLKDLEALAYKYRTVVKKQKASTGDFVEKPSGFRLFSFLDKLAGEANVKNSIKKMTPSSSAISDGPYKKSTVEMKMVGLSMEQLVDFLFRVESASYNLKVRRISIKETSKTQKTVDAVLQVETLEK